MVTGGAAQGFEECYIFAATCLQNRPPLFTAHLESGAVYSRLPIHAFRALSCTAFTPRSLEILCPWTCVGSAAHAVRHEYLAGYDGTHKALGDGRYLFTIDYSNGGFSEDPGQHKTHNLIEFSSGLIGAFPNNMLVFKDAHFTSGKMQPYKRQTIIWRTK